MCEATESVKFLTRSLNQRDGCDVKAKQYLKQNQEKKNNVNMKGNE